MISLIGAPAGTAGAAGPSSFQGQMMGIPTFAVPTLPAGSVLVGYSGAAEWYEDSEIPVRLQAVDVAVAGMQAGIYGLNAGYVADPGSFCKIVPGVMARQQIKGGGQVAGQLDLDQAAREPEHARRDRKDK